MQQAILTPHGAHVNVCITATVKIEKENFTSKFSIVLRSTNAQSLFHFSRLH